MKMLIDSTWTDASSGEWVDVCNPADGSFIDRVPSGTLDDAARAVEAAQAGKRRMAALPAHERAAILIAPPMIEQRIGPLGEAAGA